MDVLSNILDSILKLTSIMVGILAIIKLSLEYKKSKLEIKKKELERF
ncbi:hypothetical protein [Clostridium sp.]